MRLALLLAIATIGVGGCTSTAQQDPALRDDGIDRAKMTAVEQQAERSGVRVFWVNPPRKHSQ